MLNATNHKFTRSFLTQDGIGKEFKKEFFSYHFADEMIEERSFISHSNWNGVIIERSIYSINKQIARDHKDKSCLEDAYAMIMIFED